MKPHPDIAPGVPHTNKEILQLICDYCDITVEQVESSSREGEIMKCRRLASWYFKAVLKQIYQVIGDLTNRDHVSALNSYRRYQKYLLSDRNVRVETLKFINHMSRNSFRAASHTSANIHGKSLAAA